MIAMSSRGMNAEQRREQIVRMTTRLFADNGFEGTKFWQIAQACGVSEGNILYFFPNKEALHTACFRQAIRNTLPTMSEIPDRTDKALYEYALTFLTQCKKDPDSLRFFLHINLSEPKKNDILYESEAIKGYIRQLEEIIARGVESEHIRTTDICFSARAFLGTLFIIAILFEFYQKDAVNRLNDKELASKAVELFMKGLANPKPGSEPKGR